MPGDSQGDKESPSGSQPDQDERFQPLEGESHGEFSQRATPATLRWLRAKRRVEEIRASRARTVAAGLQEQMEDGTYRFKPITKEEAKTMTPADVNKRLDEWVNAGEAPNPEAKPVGLPATPKPTPPQPPVTKKGPNWNLALILVFAGSVVGSCSGYQTHLSREADLNRERDKKEAAAQAITEKAEEARAADSVPPEIKQKLERYQACIAAGNAAAVHSVDSQWMRYCLN